MPGEPTEVRGVFGLLARVLEKNGPAWFLLALLVIVGSAAGWTALDRIYKHMDDAAAKLERMTGAMEKLVEQHADVRQTILTEIGRCCPSRRP